MIKGTIGYDRDIRRYVIYGNDGRERELHCGDYFEVWLGLGTASAWIGTTIEMMHNNGVGEWYLTGERTPAYRGESFLLQREQHCSSEELLRLTLSPQA